MKILLKHGTWQLTKDGKDRHDSLGLHHAHVYHPQLMGNSNINHSFSYIIKCISFILHVQCVFACVCRCSNVVAVVGGCSVVGRGSCPSSVVMV